MSMGQYQLEGSGSGSPLFTDESDLNPGGAKSSSHESPIETGPAECESFDSFDSDLCCQECNKEYKQPRVLFCLHSFCEECIMSLQSGRTSSMSSHSDTNCELEPIQKMPKSPPGIIKCRICHQDSPIGTDPRAAQMLVPDFVTTNLQDARAIEKMEVACTSCKSLEKAVARCSECATFLCANCVQAHQFMRCFENHKVVGFEEMKRTGELYRIHKPVLCPAHPAEPMKFFCQTCQFPVCNECLLMTHKPPQHNAEKISPDSEGRAKEEFKKLIGLASEKISVCSDLTTNLEGLHDDLQSGVDHAKEQILEAFDSYRRVLETRQQEMMAELDQLHKQRETQINDTCNAVQNVAARIRDSCKFTERLLEHGNTMEILAFKRMVNAQVLQLVATVPHQHGISVNIRFDNSSEGFEQLMKQPAVGRLVFGNPPPETSIVESLYPKNMISSNTTQLTQIPQQQQQMSDGRGRNDGYLPSSQMSGYGGYRAPQQPPTPVSVGRTVSPATPQFPRKISPSPVNGIYPFNTAVPLPPTRNGSDGPMRQTYSPWGDQTPFGAMGGSTHNYADVSKGFQDMFVGQKGSSNYGIPPPNWGGFGNTFTPQNQNGSTLRSTPTGSDQVFAQHTNWGSNFSDLMGPAIMATPKSFEPPQQTIPFGSGISSQLNPSAPAFNVNSVGMGSHVKPDFFPRGSQSSSGSPPFPPVGSGVSNSPVNGSSAPILPSSEFEGGMAPIQYPKRGKQNPMTIKSKFGSPGQGPGQFNSPHGFCLGADEDIVVADTNNHRIQIFDKTGLFKCTFGVAGKEEGQMWYPRKVGVLRKSGKYVVCDRGNERSRMQMFGRSGEFIAKIDGAVTKVRGVEIVAGLTITENELIVVVDSVNPAVFTIDQFGNLLSWFDCSKQMEEPSDVAVSGNEYFVADFKGHFIAVFNETGSFLRRFGGEEITHFPSGIDFSEHGDILVADSHMNRLHITVFNHDGGLISEFECSQMKVARSCGLKINSDGYVITLAKQSHNVLIMNTLMVDEI